MITDCVRAQRIVDHLTVAVPTMKVYEGKVPDTIPRDGLIARPYAVLYPDGGQAVGESYAATSRTLNWGFQLTVAGGNYDAVLDHLAKARDALTDYLLEPENRAASKLNNESLPGPLRRDDEKPSDIRFWFPLLYTMSTTR